MHTSTHRCIALHKHTTLTPKQLGRRHPKHQGQLSARQACTSITLLTWMTSGSGASGSFTQTSNAPERPRLAIVDQA